MGGGLAGWMAATAAGELGRRTVVVERSATAPGWGNTLISGGALHAVLDDPRTAPDELRRRITELTGGESDPVVAGAWANNAGPTIDWMAAHGAPFMSDPRYPHRACVFSPVRPTVPGLHHEGFGAVHFLGALAAAFEAGGGTVMYSTRATALSPHPGGWLVALEGPGPSALAAGNVVLCDGGFQANPELLRKYVGTDQVRLRATETGTGDGLQMGLSAGGVPVQMNCFYGHLLARESLHNDALWPYPILDGLAATGVVVGPSGERVVDEGISGVTTANNVAWSKDPLGCWVVVDDEVWGTTARAGDPPANPYLLEQAATVLSGPSIDELGRLAGMDPAALACSIADATGPDAARAQPPRTGPVRLGTPPFHAIAVVAGVTFTMGGLLVDGNARVLDRERRPIPGLYAAGGTMGGLHGGPQVGYAGGLLEAAVFGLLAGTDAGRRS